MEIPAIAIIGLACRFPGAANPGQFWRNLRDGVESISRFTLEELETSGADMPSARDPQYVPARAILENSADFDAGFFGYSAREAEIMDPQHRVLLECAWEALEDSGYAAGDSALRIGVFAGAGTNSYLFRSLISNPEARSLDGFQIFLGNDKDFIPTRVSYKLNLRGPSVAVNTACSTSLVAVHMACQALLSFQCDMALAGAVSIASPEKEGYIYRQGGIHSPDGHCRAFDAQAGGTVGGNGAGIVVLKRLEDALAAGDTIRAIIRGTAINNDGAGKPGYTAPGIEGQAEVIAEAQAVAGADPGSITYIEAHGTATELGDPIEIEALTRAFRRRTDRKQYCAIGSVKTNLGHLDAAAGMAGLIKAVLALEHRAIPPTLHYRSPNPRIPFAESPFHVNATLVPWRNDGPRRAGVSSFGIGGTNAHIVLEEAPAVPPRPLESEAQVLPLSARTPKALARMARDLAEHLEAHPDLALADVAYTLQAGRKAFPWRAAVSADSPAAAARALRGLPTAVEAPAAPPIAFLFPGQGAQRAFMGAALYKTQAVFRETVDLCARRLAARLGVDVRELLASDSGALQRTDIAQCSLFTVEYAAAEWLHSLGIDPTVMLGHSLGEYVAACRAGVFSIEDALDLVATRGLLMRGLPGGSMLAISLPEGQVRPWLTPGLAIAAVNGTARTVVSGPSPEVEALQARFDRQGIPVKALRTSHAFHSPMMDPVLVEFEKAVSRTVRHAPQVPYISNVTGTWITASEAVDPAYWVRHLRQTVRFNDGLATLLANPALALVEVGPGHDLAAIAKRHPACGAGRPVLPSLESETSLLAGLWAAGAPVQWRALHESSARRRVPLPTYPFERQRFYLTAAPVAAYTPSSGEPGLGTISWVRRPQPVPKPLSGPWLVFADSCGLGAGLAALLPDPVVVEAGDQFAQLAPNHFRIDPRDPSHYQTLLSELTRVPLQIAHLFTVAREDNGLSQGFCSVFHLLRALGEKNAASGARLHLISTGMHDVTGNEPIQPEKATLLAFVRVAPQEYPDLVCRSIDVQHTDDLGGLAQSLAAELSSEPAPPIVAYRGRHRWEQTMEAIELRSPRYPAFSPTYLITGGTAGLGLEFATHLARAAKANLVLVSRSPGKMPMRAPLRLPTAEASAHERRIAQELAIRRPSSYPGLSESLNNLCALQILSYLRECGVSTSPGTRYNTGDLLRRLCVIPKFEKLVHFFLRVLCEDGIIVHAEDEIEFRKSPPGDWRQFTEDLKQRFPGFAPTIALLARCAEHLRPALSGNVEAVRVLFPDGKSHLMMEAGRDTVEHLNGRVYRLLLKELLASAVAQASGRRIRILEIGAGHGVLTGDLLPAVQGADVEYIFTDLGKAFVREAELRAAERGLGFLKFQVLDITVPPEQQGLAPETFDFIFGLDVVHATANIGQTLANLRHSLAPGGTLALVETLRVARWNEMIFGLAEGWWYFKDPEARLPGTPILDIERWQSALQTAGYIDVEAFPSAPADRAATDSGLLIARKPEDARLRQLDQLGKGVMVVQADVSDSVAMNRAADAALERFGRIDAILHCACVDDQGSIQCKVPRFEEAEFLAKITGTRILAEIAERTKPAVLLLCSSVNTITGGPGQIGYCAANSYLDAFAHAQAARGGVTRTVSVNWDRWQGIGMAARFEDWYLKKTGKPLTGGLPLEQGLAILDRVLFSETPPQVVVSAASAANSAGNSAVTTALVPQPVASTANHTPALDPPRSPDERAVAEAFEAALGGGPVGRGDNFALLGGDSLIAIQVVSRLRESLQVDLPLRSIFESPTVAQLAESVANRRWAAAAAAGAGADMEEGVL